MIDNATLSEYLSINIASLRHIAGGDTNSALEAVDEQGGRYFIKYNASDHSEWMLSYEEDCLHLLHHLGIKCPQPMGVLTQGERSFLIMEFIPRSRSKGHEAQELLENLAKLYEKVHPEFGWNGRSFLGDYKFEVGTYRKNWAEYFWLSRLKPMCQDCLEQNLLPEKYRQEDSIYIENIAKKTPAYRPTLIHGDLWSGNIYSGRDGLYLLDPATFYGIPDLDLAMLKLFGGRYAALIPDIIAHCGIESEDLERRITICQSYYLLYHLWKFGRSYAGSCMQSLDAILE